MQLPDRRSFWKEAFAVQGSVSPHVMPAVITFGILATGICSLSWLTEWLIGHRIKLEEAPYDIAGAALGLLLVLRTNAGYDRWWEARKLWGGIVNQSRNVVIAGLSYGPRDDRWRRELVTWSAIFPHVVRSSLRADAPPPEALRLLDPEQAARLNAAEHAPGYASSQVARLLREGCERFQMERFAFLQIEQERARLIDHLGGCERILKTPLALVFGIKIRRFIMLFLVTLPLALLHRLNADWLIPLITMLVAYPLLALDQIGIELQNPFSTANLSHLPLDDICATIERNVNGLLANQTALDAASDRSVA